MPDLKPSEILPSFSYKSKRLLINAARSFPSIRYQFVIICPYNSFAIYEKLHKCKLQTYCKFGLGLKNLGRKNGSRLTTYYQMHIHLLGTFLTYPSIKHCLRF